MVQRQRDLTRQGAPELLLLPPLFLHQRHRNDLRYGAGKEGEVWGRGDIEDGQLVIREIVVFSRNK